MPTFVKTKTFALNESPIASADLNSIGNDVSSFLNTTKIDEANIQPGTITGTSLSANAAIAVSKLAAGTANQVLINNATPTPAWTTLSGDLTNALGVFTIGAGAVTGAKIAAATITEANITAGTITTASLSGTAGITSAQLAGAIAAGKLTLTSANIIVGNGSNVGAGVALSGDATLANTGAMTIAASAISTAKIADNAVTSRKLSATNGIIGMTNASQGISGNADLVGANSGSITPAVNATVDIDYSIRVDNTGGTTTSITVILMESVNGGAYANAYADNSPAMTFGAGGFGTFGGRVQRSLTAGSTYAYKLQVGGTATSGNATRGPGTYIHWQIIS